MQNQLTKQQYQAIIVHIYDDLSQCLKIFKININNLKKSFLSETVISINPEAEQNSIINKKNSLVVKYYNISYRNQGLELVIHRFLCRVKETLDNQIAKIALGSPLHLIKWIKYIKNALFRQGYPKQASIGKIMETLLFPLQPEQSKTQRKIMIQNQNTSTSVKVLATNFIFQMETKFNSNDKIKHQNFKDQNFKKQNQINLIKRGRVLTKVNPLPPSQNKLQKILQQLKTSYNTLNILGIQQSQYRNLFFSARDNHFKNSMQMSNDMKFRNRYIKQLMNQYETNYKKFLQRQKKLRDKQKKRYSQSDLKLISQRQNQKRSDYISITSRKDKSLVKPNNTILNFKDKSFYTLYNYKSRKNKSSFSKTINRQNQNQLQGQSDSSLFQKTQRNILLNLGKVIFSGNKLQLCPRSQNDSQRKSRAIFYKRSKQGQRKKFSNYQKRIFQVNHAKFNEQNFQSGLQISNFKK